MAPMERAGGLARSSSRMPAPSPRSPSARRAAPVEPATVFIASRDGACSECPAPLPTGTLHALENDAPLCLRCAVLHHLELLPSGDVALTRRAAARSRTYAVVLEWSQRRKRYERRGTLVEPAALAQARAECAADAGERAGQRRRAAVRREASERDYVDAFAQAVRAHFPGCPPATAEAIARHACEKHSGRVGRTADAKALDPDKVRLAVIAHVRHSYTEYDNLRDRRLGREASRARIRPTVQAILAQWQRGVESPL
jgi:hypothetical protein